MPVKKKMDPVSWTERLTGRLIELVKTGIILTDKVGCILFTNKLASDLLGYTRGSLKHSPVKILFLPEDTDIFLPNIMKMTTDGTGFEGEALLRRKNGTTFFVNLCTVIYRGKPSDSPLLIFTIQDITHIKKMEREFFESERFAGLGMITDQISHQIRNPIVSIGGFALRLAKESVSEDDYVQYSRIIHSEAKRLEYIIDRLAEFAEVRPARYAPVTLSNIFGALREAFPDHLDSNSARLRLPEPDALPDMALFGDHSLLVRAVCSIVRNGLEAIHDRGEVTVSADVIDNNILIRVKDTGEGIAAENVPFVFDPFFTTKFNYLGLGLTMARRIVQEHKGRIEVHGTPQTGTEFRVILPKERRREIRTSLLPR